MNPFEPFKTTHGRSLSDNSSAGNSLFSCLHPNVFRYPASGGPFQSGRRQNLVRPFKPFKTIHGRSLLHHSVASYSLFSCCLPYIGQFPNMQCEDLVWQRFSSPFQPCNSYVGSCPGRGAIHYSILHTVAFENLFCILRTNEASD